jgi:hypothetical protein
MRKSWREVTWKNAESAHIARGSRSERFDFNNIAMLAKKKAATLWKRGGS